MNADDQGLEAALKLVDLTEAELFDDLAGRVLTLDDPSAVWLPVAGRVDIQAVPKRLDGQTAGAGHFLLEARPGHMLVGISPLEADAMGPGMALRGRCAAGTILYRTTREKLRALRLDLSALLAIERWTEALAEAIAPQPRALSTDQLEADPGQEYGAGAVLCAPHGAIVWATITKGTALALGEAALHPGDAAWPLTDLTWLTVPESVQIDGHLTPARMVSGAIWDDLDKFGRIALNQLREMYAATQQALLAAQERGALWTESRFTTGLQHLGSAVEPRFGRRYSSGSANHDDGWSAAFRRVADAAGITFKVADDAPDARDLEEQAVAAGVSFRSIRLVGPWWCQDSGPLLGFLADSDAPANGEQQAVALLPLTPGRYEMVMANGTRSTVTPDLARRLAATAMMLYRPLSPGEISFHSLLTHASFGAARDLRALLGMGVLMALIGLMTPIATGALTGAVLPRADDVLFGAIIGGLLGGALGNAAFSLVQAVALSRIQARLDLSAQAGVMGRLLRLPMAFFRDYSVGDLADRALALVRIRQALTGAATTALLSGLMALPAGLLLFYYNSQLALFALAFTTLVMIIEVILFLLELPRQRWVSETRGNVEACTFETLSAMPKLRAAAAETRAFARWSTLFAAHSRARREAAAVETLRTTFAIIVPQFGTALVWLGGLGMLWGGASKSMPIGDFVAFQSAIALFITGILGLARGGQTVIDVVPEWERLRPILLAREENGLGRASPGPLRGEVRISDVTFRYAPDLAPALQGLSLSIRSGEYVALAGASGSGKSTLVRLLLGLEQPQSGAIYVDGLDLATIDLGAMRRQIGVVLQTGQLPAGTLLEVILGSAPLPETQAWEAARQAGLDADIRAMPMGMQTVLSEGGGGLSGGQRQRVLIARALVRRPRVLIFDEATSALDNVTQAAVKHTLDRLNITRIVVAHRLSTIRNVHRVIVMDQGQVVEQGSFEDLLAASGHFADLAARQMA